MARDNNALLLWSLGALLLIGGGAVVYTMTRGLRNNNPGNIVYNPDPSQQWEGLDNPPTDGKFARFISPEYGIRAMARIFHNYGLNTVADIITRWAPPSENDTASYIAAVSSALGVNPDDPIVVADPTTMQNLVSAVIAQENGINPYDAGTLQAGIGMA